jgi:hypothetical protein
MSRTGALDDGEMAAEMNKMVSLSSDQATTIIQADLHVAYVKNSCYYACVLLTHDIFALDRSSNFPLTGLNCYPYRNIHYISILPAIHLNKPGSIYLTGG